MAGKGRKATRLPRPFLITVWSLILLGMLSMCAVPAVFDEGECPPPCDGPGIAASGVLFTGVTFLMVAKAVWVWWVQFHRPPPIPDRPDEQPYRR